MVMFSELKRFRLEDERRRRATLHDLAVDLSAADYPPVTRLFFREPANQPHELPWESVQRIDSRRCRIVVTDLGAGRAAPAESLKHSVLLDRDVMDAMLLDLANRHAMRANDLWLRHDDGRLWLSAADISPRAVLRRLGRGLLGRGTERHLLDWKHVEFLRGDPRAALEGRDYHRRVANLQPSEIARLLDALPYLHAAELLALISDDFAADTLEVMKPERQTQVFEELDDEQASRLLALMASDHAADLLGRLQPERAERCLEALPPERRASIVDLLRYPADTAGGIMTNQVVTITADMTIGRARHAIRDELREPDFVYYVYVLDDADSRRLAGVLTLRDLLVCDADEPVVDAMQRAVATLDPLIPAEAAARRVADHHLAALPVVGGDGRLLGAITADAALLQISPPSMSGQEPRVFT
ncbi:MAG TPA: CBS domain-containing protein [Chloroflexota bacterium]|nr:CBS domain-containing protein [Chloroflexota bacterium]